MTRDEAIRMLGEIDKRLKKARDRYEAAGVAAGGFRHGDAPGAREAWRKAEDLKTEVREIEQERARAFEAMRLLPFEPTVSDRRRAGFIQPGRTNMAALMTAIRITKPGYEGVYEPKTVWPQGRQWVNVKAPNSMSLPDLTVRRWNFEGFVEGYPSDIDATEGRNPVSRERYSGIAWNIGDRVRVHSGPLTGVVGSVFQKLTYPLVVVEMDAESLASVAPGLFPNFRSKQFRIEMNTITSLDKINFRCQSSRERYDEARDWISAKIAKLMDEGKPQKQAVAIALSMARKKFPGRVPEKEVERYTVMGRDWAQEWYETASGGAGRRSRQLRALGYRVSVEAMGSQVTKLGTLKMTIVDVREGPGGVPSIADLPPAIEDSQALGFTNYQRGNGRLRRFSEMWLAIEAASTGRMERFPFRRDALESV